MGCKPRQQSPLACVPRSGSRRMHAFALALLLSLPGVDAARTEKGSASFEPAGDQKNIPERYRLTAHKFDWEMTHKYDLEVSKVEVWKVRFPSPVVTNCKENNAVDCLYYRPKGKGPFPGVVVLDITA